MNTAAAPAGHRSGWLELPEDWLAWKPFGYARKVSALGHLERVGDALDVEGGDCFTAVLPLIRDCEVSAGICSEVTCLRFSGSVSTACLCVCVSRCCDVAGCLRRAFYSVVGSDIPLGPAAAPGRRLFALLYIRREEEKVAL